MISSSLDPLMFTVSQSRSSLGTSHHLSTISNLHAFCKYFVSVSHCTRHLGFKDGQVGLPPPRASVVLAGAKTRVQLRCGPRGHASLSGGHLAQRRVLLKTREHLKQVD